MTSRPSTAAPILAVLAIVLTMLGAYVGGYLWLGDCDEVDRSRGEVRDTIVIRRFRSPWLVSVFKPAGWIEQQLRTKIEVRIMEDWRTSSLLAPTSDAP